MKELKSNNKSGLCYNCLLAISKNNLRSLIDIYLKRKMNVNLRNKEKEESEDKK